MDTVEQLSFYISLTCAISFVSGSCWDDKIILEFPKSCKQCFASLSIYSNMRLKTCLFWYQSFSGCYCKNYLKHLKEMILYGSTLIDLFWLTIALSSSLTLSCNSQPLCQLFLKGMEYVLQIILQIQRLTI